MAETKNPKVSIDEQLSAKQKELIEAMRGNAAGELQNTQAIRKIRKEIARIMTEINTKKKGEE